MTTPIQPKRRLKLVVVIPVAIVLFVGLLVLLAPTLLSTSPGKNFILSRVNKSLAGRLDLDRLSIGWTSGVSMHGLRLADSDGNQVLSLPSLQTQAGLLSLLRGDYQLGKVTLERPVINIRLTPDGRPQLDKIVRPAAPARPKPSPTLPNLVAEITLTDGQLTVTGPSVPELHVEQLNLSASLNTFDRPVTAQVSFAVGKAGREGSVRAKGSLDNPSDVILHGAIPATRCSLALDKVDLKPFVALGRLAGLDYEWEGTLNSPGTEIALGPGLLRIKGHTDLVGFQLTGGALGPDRLSVPAANFPYDLVLEENTLTVNTLQLRSDLVTLRLAGKIQAGPHGFTRIEELMQCSLDHGYLRVDAARLLQMLPHTLKLLPDLRFDQGELTAELSGSGSGESLEANLTVILARVRATRAGQPFSLPQDWRLQAEFQRSAREFRVSTALLETGFATVNGSGSASGFNLEARADLTELHRQLGNFIDLGKTDLAGQAALNLRTAGGFFDELNVSLSGSGRDLRLGGLFRTPVQQKNVSLAGNVKLGKTESLTSQRSWDATDAEVRTDDLHLTGSAAGVLSTTALRLDRFDLQAQADLAPLTDQLRNVIEIPPQLQLAGKADIAGSGKLSSDRLELSFPRLSVENLSLTLPSHPGRPIRQTRIQLVADCTWDRAGNTFVFPQLDLKVPAGNLHFSDARLFPLPEPSTQWYATVDRFSLKAHTDLASFLTDLGPVRLPPGLKLSADQTIECTGALSETGLHLASLHTRSTDLSLVCASFPKPFQQKTLAVDASGLVWTWKTPLTLAGSWSWNDSTLVVETLKTTGDLGSADLSAVQLHLDGDNVLRRVDSVGTFDLVLSQDLKTFREQFGHVLGLPDNLNLAGAQTLQCRGSLDDKGVQLESLTARTTDLALALPSLGTTPVRWKSLTVQSGRSRWTWDKPMTLDGSWSPRNSSANLEAVSISGDFGKASLGNVLLNLAAEPAGVLASVGPVDLDLNYDLALLSTQFGKAMDLTKYRLGGSSRVLAKGTYSADRGLELASFSSTTGNLVLAVPDRPVVRQTSLTLTGPLTFRPAKLLASTQLRAAGSFGQLSLTNLRLTDYTQPDKMTASVQLQSVGELADVIPLVSAFTGADLVYGYSGKENLAATVITDRPGHITIKGSGAIDNLRLRRVGQPELSQSRVELTGDLDLSRVASRNPRNSWNLSLRSPLSVKSEMLNLNVNTGGTVADLAGVRLASLTGTMGYDAAQVSTFLSPWLPEGLALTGRRQDLPFSLKGPLSGKTPAAMFRQWQGSAGVGVDSASYHGLTLGRTDTVVTLAGQNWPFREINTTANNGTLRTSGSLNFSGNDPALQLANPDLSLDKAALSGEFAHNSLGNFLPIFFNPGQTSGLLSASTSQFLMPLSGNALRQGRMSARIQVDDLDMEVRGLLAELLKLVARSTPRVKGRIAPFDLELRDGRFHYNNLQVFLGDIDLIFDGSVGVDDKSLDLTVSLPIVPEIVPSKEVAEALKGLRIKVPIKGTTDRPVPDLAGFAMGLSELLLKGVIEGGLRSIFGN